MTLSRRKGTVQRLHSAFLLQGPSLLNLLLLLNIAGVSGSLPVTVSGFLGEQVVLPCTYKGNAPVPDLQVVWQISEREVLHQFVDGSDDLTQQDPRFRNRTNLFKDQLEHGNWSVLLSDLRQSDQNEYECLILRWTAEGFYWEQELTVHLSVTDPGLSTGAAVGLGIGILALLTLAVIGVFLIRKRRWRQSRDSSNPEAASDGGPLTKVSCSDEARGLVTTAAEHQNGAAGEQNLLGNLAVQH